MECAHHRHWPLATEIQTRLDSEPKSPEELEAGAAAAAVAAGGRTKSGASEVVTLGKGKAALESEGIGGIGISGVNCIDSTASAKAVSV